MAANVRKVLVSVALSLLLAGAVAPVASGSATGVIRDCSEDGVLNGHYSHDDLTKALEQLPSDLDEYTDCRAVIRSAQLGSAGRKHRSGRGPGILGKVDTGSPPNPDEQRSIANAAGSGGSVKIGGHPVKPGESGALFKTAGLGSDLPTPVLIALIALGATMAGAAALAVQRHRPALARVGGSRLAAPLRSLIRGVRNRISRLRR
jgi:hypothetical protein